MSNCTAPESLRCGCSNLIDAEFGTRSREAAAYSIGAGLHGEVLAAFLDRQKVRCSFDRRNFMTGRYLGSCLCGAVRFEIEGEFDRFYLCHCEYCRKDTGSAHAANLFSATATLKWVSGEDKVRQYNLPQTRHGRCFCGVCGSALPILQMNGKLLVVPAGSLDSEVLIRPDAHIFGSSRAGWDAALEEIPIVDRFPS